jgi:hypothetical protein
MDPQSLVLFALLDRRIDYQRLCTFMVTSKPSKRQTHTIRVSEVQSPRCSFSVTHAGKLSSQVLNEIKSLSTSNDGSSSSTIGRKPLRKAFSTVFWRALARPSLLVSAAERTASSGLEPVSGDWPNATVLYRLAVFFEQLTELFHQRFPNTISVMSERSGATFVTRVQVSFVNPRLELAELVLNV